MREQRLGSVLQARESACWSRPGIYTFNDRFFHKLTPESAYWLGYFFADGNVTIVKKASGRHTVVVSLCSADTEHLEKFKKSIGSNHKLVDLAHGPTRAINIYSYRMGRRLEVLGVTPRKTYTAKLPKIRAHLYVFMLRGLVDGDGCFNEYVRPNGQRVPTLCVVGSKAICESLKSRFGGSSAKKAGVFQFTITGVRAVNLVKALYADPSAPRLDRKYALAKKLSWVRD